MMAARLDNQEVLRSFPLPQYLFCLTFLFILHCVLEILFGISLVQK